MQGVGPGFRLEPITWRVVPSKALEGAQFFSVRELIAPREKWSMKRNDNEFQKPLIGFGAAKVRTEKVIGDVGIVLYNALIYRGRETTS